MQLVFCCCTISVESNLIRFERLPANMHLLFDEFGQNFGGREQLRERDYTCSCVSGYEATTPLWSGVLRSYLLLLLVSTARPPKGFGKWDEFGTNTTYSPSYNFNPEIHKLTTTKSKKEINNNNPEIATRFRTQKSDKNNHRNKLLDLQKRSESFLTANEISESTAAEVEVECSSRLEQEQQELPCCSTP
ncbi:hypothetical protein QL285_018479 [Trifolium repens]|nr:hypothetical protein QL285_018479 [Trifolium repens]